MHFFIYLQWWYRNHIKRDTYLILLFFFCFSITLRKLIQSAITLIESVSCFCNNYFCFVSNTNFTKLFWTLPWAHLWPPDICWCLISYFISYCLIRTPFERSWIKMEHLITVRKRQKVLCNPSCSSASFYRVYHRHHTWIYLLSVFQLFISWYSSSVSTSATTPTFIFTQLSWHQGIPQSCCRERGSRSAWTPPPDTSQAPPHALSYF